jgi:phosphoenolpyruvate carboxylase
MQQLEKYYEHVTLRYQLYNSLFLHLPFEGISRTGTLLTLFTESCLKGLKESKTPQEIIKKFFADFLPDENFDSLFNYLFQFIQYIERQVVLFDSTEDAAYEHIKLITGKGTFTELDAKLRNSDKQTEYNYLLQNASIRVVLTAHPTQFYPGEVLGILTDLDSSIKSNNITEIDVLLRQLGKTPFIKKFKPTPYDEAISLIWYLEHVFYSTIPELVKGCLEIGNLSISEWNNPSLFCVGFWPGGDRDGNPFVTEEITTKVASKLKNTVLKCYYRDIRNIKRRFTFKDVYSRVNEIEQKIYNGAYGNGREGYEKAIDLENDLLIIKQLIEKEHNNLFVHLIDDIILKVRILGFHFSMIDIRQHAQKHKIAWKQFGVSLNNEVEYVQKLLNVESVKYSEENIEAKNLYESILCIKNIQHSNGEVACNRYIISNTSSSADIIEIYSISKIVFGLNEDLPLDIIPLFESTQDLINAAEVMEKLFQIPEYKKHLISRKYKQTIMLGFSDGTKDAGYLTANWLIYKAKQELTAVCKKYNVSAIFFDGRGGPPARGGGNTYEFYASQGSNISSEEIQLTIQGQTISSNFGKKISCKYNLEQLFTALVENQIFPNKQLILNKEQNELMEQLSSKAFESYSKLKNNPTFIDYLENATPLKWFGETNVGSRPAKRNKSENLVFEDLRAIPFVSAWAQMKQNIPGYYGIGSAIEFVISEDKEKQLMELCEQSAFVKALFSNSMQSLAKCNFEASRWLKLNKKFSSFYDILQNEYELSKKHILKSMNQQELMEDNPVSKVSVDLREKIVLPLVIIQQFALQMLNDENLNKSDKENYNHLIIRSMFGIVNAARNSA